MVQGQVNMEGMPLPSDTDGLLSQALLLGELGPAVELCLKEERFADAIILAQAGGADLLKQTQERYLAKKKTRISLVTAHCAGEERRAFLGLYEVDVHTLGLVFRGSAKLFSHSNPEPLVRGLTGSLLLLPVLDEWLMTSFPPCPLQLLACVVRKNWKDMVCSCSLQNWREALALLLTYSGPETFPGLCGRWP